MQKIALVRLSALGDIVNSAFVLQFIKKNYPDSSITWVCEEVFAPLLAIHPNVDHLCALQLKKAKKQKSLSLLFTQIKHLRGLGDFDKIIDMQGLIKSAVSARVIGSNTHGFDKNSIREPLASFFYKTTSAIPYEENVVLRNAKVVSDALGISIPKEEIENKEPVFPVLHVDPFNHDKPNVVFVIGASRPNKIYPKERLVDVINELDVHAHIIWGNEAEKKDALFIAKQTKKARLAPSMRLDELVSFISHADLLIGNDTGPTHMAWAQNRPSITLFGPTNERMIFPTPQNIGIHSPSNVDILHIDKNDDSIKEIDPHFVATKAKELLHGL